MSITLKTILYADSDAVKLEKVNYNFDQLRKNGGGPQGPTGDTGNAGLQGAQGQTGIVGSVGNPGNNGPQGNPAFSYWVAEDNGSGPVPPEKKMWINLAHASQSPSITTTKAPSVLIGITQFHQNYSAPNTQSVLTIHKLPYAFDSNVILTNSPDEAVDYGKINFDDNVLTISYKEEDLENNPTSNGVLRLDATSFEFKSSTPNGVNSNLLDISAAKTSFYKDVYFNKQLGAATVITDITNSRIKFKGNPIANVNVTLDALGNNVPNMVAMTNTSAGKIEWYTAGEAGAEPPVGAVIDIDDDIFNEVHPDWVANNPIPYAGGSYVKHLEYTYFTAAGGASGGTAPVHTSGSVSDGGVLWLYFSTNPGKNFILKQNNEPDPGANVKIDFTIGSGVFGTRYDGWYLCNGFSWTNGIDYSFATQDLNSFKWRIDTAVGGQAKSSDYVNSDNYRMSGKVSHTIGITGSEYIITSSSFSTSDNTFLPNESGYFMPAPAQQFQHLGYSTKRLPRLIYLGLPNLKFNIEKTNDNQPPVDVNYHPTQSIKICSNDRNLIYNFPAFQWNDNVYGAFVENSPIGYVLRENLDIYVGSYVKHLDNLYEVTASPSTGQATLVTAPTHQAGSATHDSITYLYIGPARVYQFPTDTTYRLNFKDPIYLDVLLGSLAPAGWYASKTNSQAYDDMYERGYWDGTTWDITKQENCINGCSMPYTQDINVANSVAAGTGSSWDSADALMACPYEDIFVYQDSRHLDSGIHNIISQGHFNLYDDLWTNSNKQNPAPQGRYKSTLGDVRTWYNPMPPGWTTGWGSTDNNAFDYNPIMLSADNDGTAMTTHYVYYAKTNVGDAVNACNDFNARYVRQRSTCFNLHDAIYDMLPQQAIGGKPPPNLLLGGLCGDLESDVTDAVNTNAYEWWFVALGKNGQWYTRKWNGCCWEGSEVPCDCAGFTGGCSAAGVAYPGSYGGNIGGYQPY